MRDETFSIDAPPPICGILWLNWKIRKYVIFIVILQPIEFQFLAVFGIIFQPMVEFFKQRSEQLQFVQPFKLKQLIQFVEFKQFVIPLLIITRQS